MTHQHKIPDEVVEAALEVHDAEKWRYELNPVGALNPKEQMRAALQTAFSMQLGEPVAYSREYDATDPSYYDVVKPESQELDMWAYDVIPLYALKEKQS